MSTAQQRLSELNAWIFASSIKRPAPMSGMVDKGPYAVVVPTALDAIPAPTFDPEALPLFVPEAQAPASLPAIDTTAPATQDRMHCRLSHLIWLIVQGRLPPMAVIGLEEGETMQAAIDRQGAGNLDLTLYPLLCVPVWNLPEDTRAKLPFLP